MKKTIFILLFVGLFANAQNWSSNFEEAKSKAKSESKNIILVFSGSDWCANCIKLDRAIFQSEAFKNAAENWVLVKADFPKKKANKLSKEQQQANDQLAEKYNNDGNFPLVLVLSSDGNVLGKLGFKNCTAEEYINDIKSFDNSEK